MNVFKGTDNKAAVRREYDLPIIESWAEALGGQLAYFGLPGPYLEDLLEWQGCIGHATGIERYRKGTKFATVDLAAQRLLMHNVFMGGLSDRFTLLRGSVESIILEGHDVDGACPPRAYGATQASLRFRYTLVNLDFLGGIGYRSGQGAVRVQALEKLFDRQRGSDFLLIMTINVRDKLGDELTQYLESEKQQMQAGELRETLDWYVHCDVGMKAHKLKAAVPLFLRHQAQHYGFDCFGYPPVWYDGTGDNRMVHFAFRLQALAGVFPTPSTQSLSSALNLIFLTAEEGRLSIGNQQNLGCMEHFSDGQLAFLSKDSRNRLLAQMASAGLFKPDGA